MNREELLKEAIKIKSFDLIIIGGGATGVGACVDARSRGLNVLLLEQHDFGKGTSSKSTKLIHGGLRYLEQGNIKLVKEGLKERGLLMKNAPHLVKRKEFLIPVFSLFEKFFYWTGLKLYDFLAFSLSLGSSRILSKESTLSMMKNLNAKDLKGGVTYFDAQFDDCRLLITLVKTAFDLGGICLNYIKVIDLIKTDGLVKGVIAQDLLTMTIYEFSSDVVLNATGVFSDEIRLKSDPSLVPMIAPSQGIHLVLPKRFLEGQTALMIPKTSDGRVLFVIPWEGSVLIGTTDTLKEHFEYEPEPLDEEITFILNETKKYLAYPPEKKDILSIFSGLRPLIKKKDQKSKTISRDHVIEISSSKLVTITGGKWTTYRKMAEEAINICLEVANKPFRPSKTKELKIHGFLQPIDPFNPLNKYGTDQTILLNLYKEEPSLREQLHPHLPYTIGEIVFAIRYEMAKTIEDILARRTRALFIDAKAAIESSHEVGRILAKELGKTLFDMEGEIHQFSAMAKNYCLNSTKTP